MNGRQHKMISVTVVTISTIMDEYEAKGTLSEETVIATITAFASGSLPDLIEPALHPNHRQFFHSIAFGLGVAYGAYKVYQWEPKDEFDRWMRRILLAVATTYIIHLIADSTTPKSIPLI